MGRTKYTKADLEELVSCQLENLNADARSAKHYESSERITEQRKQKTKRRNF